MPQTYRTRVLTAQDNRLIDALAKVPRFQGLAETLRPSRPKPPPKRAKVEAVDAEDLPAFEDDDDRDPPRPVGRPRKGG